MSNYIPASPKVLQPHEDAIAVMEGVRFSDLQTFETRMERLCRHRIDWARAFGWTGTLLLGASIAGGLGLIPFLTTNPGPSRFDRLLYIGLVVVGAAVAIVCGAARMAVREQRVDSIQDLKDDFQRWMDAYRQAREAGEA